MVIKYKPTKTKTIQHSWVLFGLKESDILTIQKEVDTIFSSYSFYPEIEWDVCMVFPPENHQVMGAWRNKKANTFAFLLDNPAIYKDKRNRPLLVYLLGEERELTILEPQFVALKEFISVEQNVREGDIQISKRLTRLQKSKYLAITYSIIGVWTASINAFAYYLRTVSLPSTWNSLIVGIWNVFSAIFHLSAILLIVIMVLFLIIFTLKYIFLLVKKI
jgi:hypothetical protein